jgi:alpha-methylacyl-CoA racemase
LHGVRVVELGGIGPVPHAAMILADLGADVVRVDRPGASMFPIPAGVPDPMLRGRRTISLDLKIAAQRAALLKIVGLADVLVESNRPGVTERLGVGPEQCHEVNPGLIYARMTGWGQNGPLASRAGHDINYISLTGALHAIGRAGEPPPPPINLLGDYGGGSMLVVVGILAALLERQRSGLGEVIDAAMLDGAALLTEVIWAQRGAGVWSDQRAANILDGGAPFYDTYACSDGRFVAVGAIEPTFFAQLADALHLDVEPGYDHFDRSNWPSLRGQLAAAFATRTRDEWAAVFSGSDACVTPVLTFAEAQAHPHVSARNTLLEIDGIVQPAPAPRFSRSRTGRPSPPAHTDTQYADVIAGWQRPPVSDPA